MKIILGFPLEQKIKIIRGSIEAHNHNDKVLTEGNKNNFRVFTEAKKTTLGFSLKGIKKI